MAINSAGNVLRETNNPPLTNNNAPISGAQYDQNIINIYDDLVALNTGGDVDAYDNLKEYDNVTNQYVSYGSVVWQYINATATIGNTPTEGAYWTQVPPSTLAHVRNKDTYLDKGGDNEVSASDLKKLVGGSGEMVYKGRISQEGTNPIVLDDYLNPNGFVLTSTYGSIGNFVIGGFVGETFQIAGQKYEISIVTNFGNNSYTHTAGVTANANESIIINTKISGVNSNDVLLIGTGASGIVNFYQVLTITKY
jgi:hypothetical protein